MGGTPGSQPRSAPEDYLGTDRPPTREEQLRHLMQLMQRKDAAKQLKMHMLNLKGDIAALPMASGNVSGGDSGQEGR